MRHHRRTNWHLALALCVLAFTAAPQGQEKRLITETDLYKFVWIADPQISLDGTHVAFTRVVVNPKHEDYETSIWLVPASGREAPRTLTSGTRDSSPRSGRCCRRDHPSRRPRRTRARCEW